jgi:hypothetical protein
VSSTLGWTPQRRARQSAAIAIWRPWERSTGPKTAEGKARSSRNADRGGQREKLRAELHLFREMIRELEAEQREGL